jgi:hypothetical protein
MRWLSAVVLLSILHLAGCGSTGNPNAPTSKAPHEKTWVTYHRNDIVNGGVAKTIVDGNLINEHVIQCKECHGADFMGAKTGNAGPACLDCHVLDPVKYPVMCYSCHGGYPVVSPLGWYSTNRATRSGLPLDPTFFSRVDEVHLKHKTVPNSNMNITIAECAVCHGEKNEQGKIHHNVVMRDLSLGCLGPLPNGCHTFNSATFTLLDPDCNYCHF